MLNYRAICSSLLDLWHDRSGNVAVMTALMMPVLGGMGALGVEVGLWYQQQKAMQHAADSAAVAAASVAKGTTAEQLAEAAARARSVAASYGFRDDDPFIKVTAEPEPTCPASPSGRPYSLCYKVTIAKLVPTFLSRIVNYEGSVDRDDNNVLLAEPRTKIVARAVGGRYPSSRDYCVVALGQTTVDNDIDVDGGAKADLSGCGIMSNQGMECVGKAEGFTSYADSPTGDLAKCGAEPSEGGKPVGHSMPTPPLADKFKNYVINPGTCESKSGSEYSISGTLTGSTKTYCGNVVLSGPVTADNMTIFIKDGYLHLNNKTFVGNDTTLIFTGTDASLFHGLKDGTKGTLDIKAPTSGDWKGVALYQDPVVTKGVNLSIEGNDPEIKLKGLVYMPNASLVIKGAINKDVDPKPCMVLVVGSLRIAGTGYFAASGNACQGLVDLPSLERGRLAG